MSTVNKQRNRVLVINKFAPPQIEGVAILLGRLLKYFAKNSCVILCDRIYRKGISIDTNMKLPFKYYYFYLPEFRYKGSISFLHMVSELLPFLLIPFLILKGLYIVGRENANKILAVNSSGVFLISAYYISKLTGRDLYVYLFDVFKYNYIGRIQRGFARLYEERILRSAKRIFVSSEKMQEHYESEYGLVSEMIPHPVEISENGTRRDKNGETYKIIFTGRINKFSLDSLQRLVKVVREIDNVRLDLYSPNLEEKDALEMELSGRNVSLKNALVTEMPVIQKDADLLYLPMGFDKRRAQECIRTAAPGKIGEYLVSGVPILINAPEHSYISWYAKKYAFAYVVNSVEERELRDAIFTLLKNKMIREELVRNALSLAKRHDVKVVASKLQSFLQEE